MSHANEARIINSNSIVADKLEKLAKFHNEASKRTDGFSAGIATEIVEVQEEPEIDYIEVAKSEAEQILQQAKQEANLLIDQANMQSDQIRKNALQDGKQQGYEEGITQASEKANLEQQEFDARKEQLEEEYKIRFSDMEAGLLDVIVEVVEKVFHIQFSDKKEILLYLISNTITNVDSCKEFQIRTGQDNYLYIETHKEDITSRIGQDIRISVVADSSMSENECTIETDVGIFECGLGIQMENLVKDIKSMCS